MKERSQSIVMIEPSLGDLRETVERIMDSLAPRTFAGATVLIKPNMVGPSPPELGHTTHPALVRGVLHACLDRNARVMVGDNPGGIQRSSRRVAEVTGILEASEGLFCSISDRVVEKKGEETGHPLVVSRAVLDADYVINLPKFKTHLGMMITGAIKNSFGYIAGACKARLHVAAGTSEAFAQILCDVHQVRPPDLHILDAITVIEGNGPCHGGQLREVGKIMAGTDPLALDAVMARMMGVNPLQLPVQKAAFDRDLGRLHEQDLIVRGSWEPIPDFKMPVTFFPAEWDEAKRAEIARLYPSGMMRTRTKIKPKKNEDKCIECGQCEQNCPTGALKLEPEFRVSDECIACYCCVELCEEGGLEVPDVEAYRHY